MSDSPKVGETIYFNGKPCTVVWSSEDMTDEERREGERQAAELMMAFGIQPIAPELREAVGLPEMSVEALTLNELAEFRAQSGTKER